MHMGIQTYVIKHNISVNVKDFGYFKFGNSQTFGECLGNVVITYFVENVLQMLWTTLCKQVPLYVWRKF
jgi:hypothetical protein